MRILLAKGEICLRSYQFLCWDSRSVDTVTSILRCWYNISIASRYFRDVTRELWYNQDFFVTVRAGTAYRHLFPSKEKTIICNVYCQRISDFRLVSTGTYYLVPAPISLEKKPWVQLFHSRIDA